MPYDEVVTRPGAMIASPNYPDDYENNQDCEITIRFTTRIRLIFLAFDVEENYPNCTYDYLRIFDGPSSSSPQLFSQGNLCGSTIPYSMVSTGNAVRILFHSDSSTVEGGFKIQAEAYDGGKATNFSLRIGYIKTWLEIGHNVIENMQY